MSSEVDKELSIIDELAEDTVTHLRTDDGSLRYPISITDAIFMDSEETVKLTDYLRDMGTSTIFAKQIFAVQFVEDTDGYYIYEFQNPFNTNRVICNLRNNDGENLVCACTISNINVQVKLVEPEDCWILLTGDEVGNVVIDGAGDIASHSHTNKVTLDRMGNLDGRLTYNGNSLAYESLIGDLSKIHGENIVDILLDICDRLDIDLGEPNSPVIPNPIPVITTPNNSIIRKTDSEEVVLSYEVVSETASNRLVILIDNEEYSQEEINATSGYITVGPFSAGKHSVTLRIIDGNGLISEDLVFSLEIEETVVIELEKPDLITTSSSTLSFTDKDVVTISYMYTSPTANSALYYGIDDEMEEPILLEENEGMGDIEIGPLAAGEYTFTMYIIDNNSQKSEENIISLIVDISESEEGDTE